LLLAPAIAHPPLFPRCRYEFFNFHTYSQRILRPPESGPLFGCSFTHLFILSDLYVSPISSSAIYMFFRSHPQRIICFYDFIFSDLYVYPISSSAIYLFFRSHPQRFICFSNLILRLDPRASTPGLCCFALVPLATSAGLSWALLGALACIADLPWIANLR
jgi:hypothetical protein